MVLLLCAGLFKNWADRTFVCCDLVDHIPDALPAMPAEQAEIIALKTSHPKTIYKFKMGCTLRASREITQPELAPHPTYAP